MFRKSRELFTAAGLNGIFKIHFDFSINLQTIIANGRIVHDPVTLILSFGILIGSFDYFNPYFLII